MTFKAYGALSRSLRSRKRVKGATRAKSGEETDAEKSQLTECLSAGRTTLHRYRLAFFKAASSLLLNFSQLPQGRRLLVPGRSHGRDNGLTASGVCQSCLSGITGP